MWKQQLCMALVKGFDLDGSQQLHHIKSAGFDGFFALWQCSGDLDGLAAEAKELRLVFQSIHAPFHKARDMWNYDETGEIALQELLDCLTDCVRLAVPIMVVHPYKGFDIEPPNEIGLERFGRLIDQAEKVGVKIAFENVEGEEHLKLLFDRWSGHAYYAVLGFLLVSVALVFPGFSAGWTAAAECGMLVIGAVCVRWLGELKK